MLEKIDYMLEKEELKYLAKECLSIISTANSKDNEIGLLIDSAIADLQRLNIKIDNLTDSSLIKSAIIMFVKANFGNVDIKEKERSMKTYNLLITNLSLSSNYRSDNNV